MNKTNKRINRSKDRKNHTKRKLVVKQNNILHDNIIVKTTQKIEKNKRKITSYLKKLQRPKKLRTNDQNMQKSKKKKRQKQE